VQVVEARDHLFDGGLLDVNVVDGVSAAMAAINLAAGILAGSNASSSERPLRDLTATPSISRAGASCAKSTHRRRSAKTPERACRANYPRAAGPGRSR